MKGDFSRVTFDNNDNDYTGTRLQQGRVLTDWDFNENQDILAWRRRRARSDMMGTVGVRDGDLDAFRVAFAPSGDLRIKAGRIYVDGMLVKVDDDTDFDVLTGLSTPGTYMVYLVAWEETLRSPEEPELIEVALEGPDTSARSKIVWSIGVAWISSNTDATQAWLEFASPNAWRDITSGVPGTMTVSVEAPSQTTDPCLGPSAEGYRGLENQLYRVEIHQSSDGGPSPLPTYKWSRENASIVTFWVDDGTWPRTPSSPDNEVTITVGSVGSGTLGFAAGDKVELTSNGYEAEGRPGVLGIISEINGSTMTIALESSADLDRDEFGDTPKVRRWEMASGEDLDPVIPTGSPSQELEDGISIRFNFNPATHTFKTGDYWTFAARTITGQVHDFIASGEPPRGPERRYAPLYTLVFDGTSSPAAWALGKDCRLRFPPLTELTRLSYVCGDGQPGYPGMWLRHPLRVGVTNGNRPVQNALVRFEIMSPTTGSPLEISGELSEDPYGVSPAPADFIDILTGSDGIASVYWKPGTDLEQLDHEVRATLYDHTGSQVGLPVCFHTELPNFWLIEAELRTASSPNTVVVVHPRATTDDTSPFMSGEVKIQDPNAAFEMTILLGTTSPDLTFYAGNIVVTRDGPAFQTGAGPFSTSVHTPVNRLIAPFAATPTTMANGVTQWELTWDATDGGLNGAFPAGDQRVRVRIFANLADNPDESPIGSTAYQWGTIEFTFILNA
ncbi:MAG: hypothetical protein H6739_36545 [Alphaproteobacteria bacterium]|nr:hypothetical protein [Alphaproteobacteria bacterium]